MQQGRDQRDAAAAAYEEHAGEAVRGDSAGAEGRGGEGDDGRIEVGAEVDA